MRRLPADAHACCLYTLVDELLDDTAERRRYRLATRFPRVAISRADVDATLASLRLDGGDAVLFVEL